ncbi:nicotinamidase isoform X2 [Xylocopa sonorina]|uniref:nicotinamidase isoform X2 n=1 Tax=Xylocopa sonorina TaxID=1818115 RepID=UPI00403AAAC9
MESSSSKSSICGDKDGTVGEFLAQFDFLELNGSLNYENFCSICDKLFTPGEIEQHKWRICEIFRLFDADKDGLLKEKEYKIFCAWARVIYKPVSALLIVDVQNDFIDGSLSLRECEYKQDGTDVVEPINCLVENGCFDKIIYSLDWHPENHISFYENLHLRELHPESKVTKENAKLFDKVMFADPCVEQILWPKHCVMNSWGAALHKDLIVALDSEQVRKGQNPEIDAYSVFFDNNSKAKTELQNILRKSAVTHVYVCGLAYDVCVKATCMDGLRLGYALVFDTDEKE